MVNYFLSSIQGKCCKFCYKCNKKEPPKNFFIAQSIENPFLTAAILSSTLASTDNGNPAQNGTSQRANNVTSLDKGNSQRNVEDSPQCEVISNRFTTVCGEKRENVESERTVLTAVLTKADITPPFTSRNSLEKTLKNNPEKCAISSPKSSFLPNSHTAEKQSFTLPLYSEVCRPEFVQKQDVTEEPFELDEHTGQKEQYSFDRERKGEAKSKATVVRGCEKQKLQTQAETKLDLASVELYSNTPAFAEISPPDFVRKSPKRLKLN